MDADLNILHAIGEFRKYASLPVQGFSINLADMLGPDLKHIVQASVKLAEKENTKTYYENAVYQHNGISKALDLIVKPLVQKNLDNEVNFVLTFIEKEIGIADLQEVEKLPLPVKPNSI